MSAFHHKPQTREKQNKILSGNGEGHVRAHKHARVTYYVGGHQAHSQGQLASTIPTECDVTISTLSVQSAHLGHCAQAPRARGALTTPPLQTLMFSMAAEAHRLGASIAEGSRARAQGHSSSKLAVIHPTAFVRECPSATILSVFVLEQHED